MKYFTIVKTKKETNSLIVLNILAESATAALLSISGTSESDIRKVGRILICGEYRVSTVQA